MTQTTQRGADGSPLVRPGIGNRVQLICVARHLWNELARCVGRSSQSRICAGRGQLLWNYG